MKNIIKRAVFGFVSQTYSRTLSSRFADTRLSPICTIVTLCCVTSFSLQTPLRNICDFCVAADIGANGDFYGRPETEIHFLVSGLLWCNMPFIYVTWYPAILHQPQISSNDNAKSMGIWGRADLTVVWVTVMWQNSLVFRQNALWRFALMWWPA